MTLNSLKHRRHLIVSTLVEENKFVGARRLQILAGAKRLMCSRLGRRGSDATWENFALDEVHGGPKLVVLQTRP